MRRLLLTLLATAALAPSAVYAQNAGAAADMPNAAPTRVVVQVSEADPARWNLVLNNVKNLQDDLGAKNVTIEVVAYGPGIGMLKNGSAVAQRIDEATLSGVKVVACENTMHAQKLTKADMTSGISYVPAGVVEIMKRQQQGWSYIRP